LKLLTGAPNCCEICLKAQHMIKAVAFDFGFTLVTHRKTPKACVRSAVLEQQERPNLADHTYRPSEHQSHFCCMRNGLDHDSSDCRCGECEWEKHLWFYYYEFVRRTFPRLLPDEAKAAAHRALMEYA